MVPDFEFFLRLSDDRFIAHSFVGLFVFCIPVGLICLYLFHNLLKFPLLSLLPHNHQSRLHHIANGFTFFPFKRFCSIVLALMIGAVSHLTWDALTHESGWMISLFPILEQHMFTAAGMRLKVYDVLQHCSSIGGIVVLVYSYRMWYKHALVKKSHTPAEKNSSVKLFILNAGIGGISCCAGILYAFKTTPPVDQVTPFIALALVASVSALFLVWIVYSCFWHTKKIFSRRLSPPLTLANKRNSRPGK